MDNPYTPPDAPVAPAAVGDVPEILAQRIIVVPHRPQPVEVRLGAEEVQITGPAGSRVFPRRDLMTEATFGFGGSTTLLLKKEKVFATIGDDDLAAMLRYIGIAEYIGEESRRWRSTALFCGLPLTGVGLLGLFASVDALAIGMTLVGVLHLAHLVIWKRMVTSRLYLWIGVLNIVFLALLIALLLNESGWLPAALSLLWGLSVHWAWRRFAYFRRLEAVDRGAAPGGAG